MDLTPYLSWIVFIHIVGAFGFVLSHGVSAFVAFRVRAEHEPARIAALLDLSASSLGAMYTSLLVVFVAGVVAAIVGGYFNGRFWPWAAIATLIVVAGAMYPLATEHYTRLRRALGLKTGREKPGDPPAVPLDAAGLAALLDNRRPEAIAAVGGVGLLILLWLMVLKPF
jgi:hypothetical protein